jgi:hypothetical protein
MTIRTAAAVAILLMLPLSLACQQLVRPSDEECDRAVGLVERAELRSETAREFRIIRSCGAKGGAALAQLLRRTSGTPSTEEFDRSVNLALGFRDASILTTSLALASNRSAQIGARTAAFRVLLSMISGMRVTHASLITEGSLCRIFSLSGQAEGAQLPTDYLTQIREAAESVRHEGGSAAELRSAAECVSTAVRGATMRRPPTTH